MAEYVCPEEIVNLHDADPPRGRAAALAWADKLPLVEGDVVWMPGVGWVEKTGPRADN